MRRRINLPFDYIHDVGCGFGRILIPVWRDRWLMLTKKRQFRLTRHGSFHNCTATGVF